MGDHATEFHAFDLDRDGRRRNSHAPSYARLSQSDRRFLKDLEALPLIGSLTVEEERARMRAGQMAKCSDYPVEVQEFVTETCSTYLIRPLAAESPAPIIFYLHGGGWALGDLYTHTRLVCELAVRTQSVVAFVDYPRAPENPFPAPLEACISAVYAVLDAAASLGLDPRRFVIGGDSSGGNLTAALILSAIEHNLPLPVRQVLLYPVTSYSGTAPSHEEFRTNANLSYSTMRWFWETYTSASHSSNPRVSPIYAEQATLSKFPPTLVITCEYDILRDEGEQFAAQLIQADVDVVAVRWLGSLHGFLVTESLATSASAQACIDTVAQYVKRGLALS